jgi:hypothetical protein
MPRQTRFGDTETAEWKYRPPPSGTFTRSVPARDGDGFDLISDRLRRGPIWYAGPDAVRNAVAYAKYHSHSRSHRAIIRVFDESSRAIETHEFAGDFRKRQADPKNYEAVIRFR